MYDDWKCGLTDMFGQSVDDCEIHQEGEEEPEYILKTCSCGREYEVLEFLCLSAPKEGSLYWVTDGLEEDAPEELFGVMRNCHCGSTMMVSIESVSDFVFGGEK